MTPTLLLAFAFGIGVITGLRSLTGPAVVSWMIRLRGLSMHGSHLSFMASLPAAILLALLAAGELIGDKRPRAPSRTTPGPFSARILLGALAGATLLVAANGAPLMGAILGAVGAVVGTLGGYQARTRTVKALQVPDFVIALLEDAAAVGGAILIASQI